MITKQITRSELDHIKLANLKAHIITTIPDAQITKDAWQSFGKENGGAYPFEFVEAESYGDIFEMARDKSSFIINHPVLFEFSGCVHFQNDSGTDRTPEIGTRIIKNGSNEARCSQIYWSGTIKNGGENTIKYGGTDVAYRKGDYINLQHYVTTNAGIDFISNAIFDNQVAATLYLKVVGLPQFTKNNEKINWEIIE